MKNQSKMIHLIVLVALLGFFIAGTGDLYAQSKKIICPQCGEENDADAKFCWNDGYDLSKIQQQKVKVKPVEKVEPEKLSPLELETKPRELKTSEIAFGDMSSLEMNQFLTKLTNRLQAANENRVRNPNYIGDLTQAQFRVLLENTLRNQNIVRTKVITKKESGFGNFLKIIGGTTLIIFGIGILSVG